MSRKFGFELLAEQIGEYVGAYAESMCAQAASGKGLAGDSPIEQLLFLALLLFDTVSGNCVNLTRGDVRGDFENVLFCQPQAEIGEVGRVDFLFQCRRSGEDKISKLIVECDGHDFHERTKEQAAKDRARDRAATLLDYQVFRFTGAELWNDPFSCAHQIIKWAMANE